jgi:hypothetical protein
LYEIPWIRREVININPSQEYRAAIQDLAHQDMANLSLSFRQGIENMVNGNHFI